MNTNFHDWGISLAKPHGRGGVYISLSDIYTKSSVGLVRHRLMRRRVGIADLPGRHLSSDLCLLSSAPAPLPLSPGPTSDICPLISVFCPLPLSPGPTSDICPLISVFCPLPLCPFLLPLCLTPFPFSRKKHEHHAFLSKHWKKKMITFPRVGKKV